jgi:hypothetical protein
MSIRNTYPTIRPSLNLDFARSRTLDPRITFSRTTTGTYMDSDGLIKVASADEARFDHKYEDGNIVSLGLLVEESRSNLLTYSNDFTIWVKQTTGSGVVGVAVTDATTSPDGANNSSKFYVDTAGGSFYSIYRSIGINSNTDYTYSVFVKQAESSVTALTVYTGSNGGNQSVFYNLSNGTVTGITTSGTNTGISTAGIISYPNDWYRCHMTFNVNESITVSYKLGNGTTTLNEGIYIYGAQVEEGSFPTSYIPRPDNSTATRNPDSVTMTGNNFSDWYNQDEGTIYVSQKLKSIDTVDRNSAVYLINGGSGNDLFYNVKTGDTNIFVFGDGGTIYSRFGESSDSTDSTIAWAYDVSGDDFKAYYNGIEATNETSNNTPSATSHNQLELGATAGAKYNGHISKLSYYPRRLSNSQLQNLTK